MKITTEPRKKILIEFEDDTESTKFAHFIAESFDYTQQGLTDEEIRKGRDFMFDLYKSLSR